MHRCQGLTRISLLLLSGLAWPGCAERPAPPAGATAEARGADRIAAFERPEALVAGASRRLADNIDAADIGREFGVPDSWTPYPDTYWPYVYEGTDWRWNPRARDPRSPIEKYMIITAPYALEAAKEWEHQNHGTGVHGVEPWYGHCPGWAAAATSSAPILHAVLAGADGWGGLTACSEGQPGCVRFEIGDVNALMAEIYVDGPAALIGGFCNAKPSEIPRDRYGRILREGCDGVNAGSLLIAVSTLLRRYQRPFVMDVQRPASTDEVWNQPAYRYHVYDYHPLTTSEAANLVAHGTSAGAETSYRWNPAARGFAFVDLGVRFVGEESPHLVFSPPGGRPRYEVRVAAVIELDADPTSPGASILGGEYLDLPASSASRLSVAPFLWVSLGAGPEDLPWTVGGTHHNPYVRPSLVSQLMALGQR
jgi:hypothetical protein